MSINPCVFPLYCNISDASDSHSGGRPALDVHLGTDCGLFYDNGEIVADSDDELGFVEELTSFAVNGGMVRNGSNILVDGASVLSAARNLPILSRYLNKMLLSADPFDYLYGFNVYRDGYLLLTTGKLKEGLDNARAAYFKLFKLAQTHDLYVRLSNSSTTDILLITSASANGVTTFNYTLLLSK